jgi:gamma-glutamylcyclotransferase (GGCT)/AIG2-like uncharacterized protein YtfP
METLSYKYFAYGSNLNFLQMEQRCPGARLLGRGILPDYRFHLYSRGYASVMQKKGATVWGGIWKISEADLVTLDRYEAVAYDYYYRDTIPVFLVDASQETVDCQVYIGSDSEDGPQTRPNYMKEVIDGARDCNLPEEYVRDVLQPWIPPKN